ncbi:MAG: DEAD/DEAH box helicase [Saprospiraceae bacterium]
MSHPTLGKLLFKELEKIRGRTDLPPLNQVEAAYQLLNLVYIEATKEERLRFNTLFARIAYAAQKYRLSRPLQFYVHNFRKQASDALFAQSIPAEKNYLPELGFKVLFESISRIYRAETPPELQDLEGGNWPFPLRPAHIKDFKPHARVIALDHFPLEKQLLLKDEDLPDADIRMQYDLPDHNEQFTPSIRIIAGTIGFPVALELVDIEIDENGIYRPRAIVIEPDYLTDVTAIAECFKEYGPVPEFYLLKKFLPFQSSIPLLQGNMANFFLDELMINPGADFPSTLKKLFRVYPLNFSALDDMTLKKLLDAAQKHFLNLRKVILQDFPELGIRARECYLEPSFYASTYGIQGRLDVFFHQGKKSAIVELKSGKVYKPNIYGINHSHYIQTLLYDLIIRSVFGKEIDPVNYILYSGIEDRHLRFGPVTKTQQFEALQVRNRLLEIEYELASLGCNEALGKNDLLAQGKRWLRRLSPTKAGYRRDSFVERDTEQFLRVLEQGDETAQRYFYAFSGFIAREHKLSKIGIEGLENVNGQASLWRSRIAEKEAGFEILGYLQILENLAATEAATVRFSKTDRTNPLANFRLGDIAILYPLPEEGQTPLFNQLFKCTIVALDTREVTVQLRARQFNDRIFRAFQHWNLEHDLMDNSFTNMYRGLFEFIGSPEPWRNLLLGQTPPALPEPVEIVPPAEMTLEQGDIFQKILSSKDYFLLWGPPGTGKTSVMLKYLLGHWFTHSRETLLLLAYTNRAVDEICAAIESFDPALRNQYLRVGSRFSTAPEYQERLLQVQCESLSNRQEIRSLLDGCRVFAGTVASVIGKNELLDLKSFDRVIIDEASQIPEPLLAGFLPRFRHALLIGDHKQLPAVVRQDEQVSVVEDLSLNALGIHNLRNSLFERLYKRCQAQGWDWAYAQLSHQGRMHREVMAFSNRQFYEGKLKILPESVSGFQAQVMERWLEAPGANDPLQAILASHRMLFFPTPPDDGGIQQKVNRFEAVLARDLLAAYAAIYASMEKPFTGNTLGIITPYRAQIAQVRFALQAAGLEHLPVTIDTVERYQGGARDIILISLCTNASRQMRSLVSLSEEGIDRKLNVALTRAREAVVLIGNPEILLGNPVYGALLQQCHWVENSAFTPSSFAGPG